MNPEPGTFFILCPLIFLAGLIDAVAGGGGLVSLPAYLLAGVPIHFALGTNKLSSCMGTAVASWRYYKNKFVDLVLCLPSMAAALAGSALGTSLTLVIPEGYLEKILLVLLPATAFYVLKNKKFDRPEHSLSRARSMVYAIIISFLVGGYDGFFGPGAGTFYILLYTAAAGIEGRTASGNAKFVNLASNLAALAVFLSKGRVILSLGLCAGFFGILGAYLGSGLAIRRGVKLIRYFILIVLVLLFIKISWDTLDGMGLIRPWF
ncbi:MAG: TSUP family transporter [Treponema sp.]|nr:TSUP family transporter [Treponema sp.]